MLFIKRSLSQVARNGINQAIHLREKYAEPNKPIAAIGDILYGCGMILPNAAMRMRAVRRMSLECICDFMVSTPCWIKESVAMDACRTVDARTFS
jgi:hypothetical protein